MAATARVTANAALGAPAGVAGRAQARASRGRAASRARGAPGTGGRITEAKSRASAILPEGLFLVEIRSFSPFRSARAGLLLLTGCMLFGCGSKGAVSLSARVDNATLTVRPLALGTQLSGEFDLLLELGSAAPGSTTVSLGTFSLKGEQDAVVDALTTSASETFPVVVGAGESKVVHFVLDDSELVEAAVGDALCSGDVWYSGTVTDTLSDGRPTVASSTKLTPSCE